MRTAGVVLASALVLAVGSGARAAERIVPVASPYGIVQVQTQYHPGAVASPGRSAPVVTAQALPQAAVEAGPAMPAGMAMPIAPAMPATAPNVIYVPSQPCAGSCATPSVCCSTMCVRSHPSQLGSRLHAFGRMGMDHPHFQKLRDWLSYCPCGNCRLCDHCTPHCQPKAYAWFLDRCYLCQHCDQPVVPGAACTACQMGGCGKGGCASHGKLATPCGSASGSTGGCGASPCNSGGCGGSPCRATSCGTPCSSCGTCAGGRLGRLNHR